MFYLAYGVAGLFVFDESNRLVKSRLFEKNPEEIARKINLLEKGEEIPELSRAQKESFPTLSQSSQTRPQNT